MTISKDWSAKIDEAASELQAEADGTRPVSLQGYENRCRSWAEPLHGDAGGNIPNGLHAVVGELVAWYGTAAVLEAVTHACNTKRTAAVQLAEYAAQLAALSREVLAGGKRNGLPKLVEARCEWVLELAGRVREGCE